MNEQNQQGGTLWDVVLGRDNLAVDTNVVVDINRRSINHIAIALALVIIIAILVWATARKLSA